MNTRYSVIITQDIFVGAYWSNTHSVNRKLIKLPLSGFAGVSDSQQQAAAASDLQHCGVTRNYGQPVTWF